MDFPTQTHTWIAYEYFEGKRGWAVVAKEFTLKILALNVRTLACCTLKRITCINTSHTKLCATMRSGAVEKTH